VTEDDAALAIRTQGYVLLRALLDPALCREIVRALEEDRGDGSRASPHDGHVIRDLERVCPLAVQAVADERVLRIARAYLGSQVEIEALAGIVSDRRRPFMPWHCHVGGVDQERVRPTLSTMTITSPRRVMCLAYPEGCAGESGALVVAPRRLGDPLGLPGPANDPSWPDAVEIHAEPGTVVVADEALYHAVLPQTRPGLRSIVGAYFVPIEPSMMSSAMGSTGKK
jgi:hypothetical protein